MKRSLWMLLASSAWLVACSQAANPASAVVVSNAPDNRANTSVFHPLPRMTVHKSPSCGCCHLWVEHVRDAGFTVAIKDTDDLASVKHAHGIADDLASCHTAEVEGYVIEGHVPAQDIERLLRERPDIRGLAVPGMPMGSPGMETPDGHREAYVVLALHKDGQVSEFARHGQ